VEIFRSFYFQTNHSSKASNSLFDILLQISQFLSDIIFSILLAALLSLVFESPARRIEKTLLHKSESTAFVILFQQLKTSIHLNYTGCNSHHLF
jgi:peptidoglycan/LPS O-acetylase OafA/YrhL